LVTTYRGLAQQLQKRAGLSFDESLVSLSIVIKAIAHGLSREESAIFKLGLPPELKQLVVESRVRPALPTGRHNGRTVVDIVSTTLEIDLSDAKRRIVACVDELRAAMGPWDDVVFAELLDRLRAEVDSVLVQAAVA